MGCVSSYDFSGWATKNDLTCIDGRIIRKDAFKVNDGQRVPLVWNHQHNSVSEILGHAILENREDGVYAYCTFNNTPGGQNAKECVAHGDVTSLSIWANNLKQDGPEVRHGSIREVSLVVAGANPGAFIESVVAHSEPMEDFDDEGIFYTGCDIELYHAAEPSKEEELKKKEEEKPMEKPEEKKDDKTIQEVFDTLNEEQKTVVYALIGQAMDDSGGSKEEPEKKEEEEMKHNIFEGSNEENGVDVISHSQMVQLIEKAKKGKVSSLRELMEAEFGEGAVLAHSIDTTGMTTATGKQKYGFNDPSMLFSDYKALNSQPEWIKRDMDWVQKVMSGVHHTPFSRIKSLYANITEDEARAKGYIKANQKKEEVFTTLKRTTDPQTVYKLQKMDRDDIVDITDFDVIAWIKAEMRMMLEEEIARAILIGDGRPSDSEFKIKEENIRPIAKDVALFNTQVPVVVAADADEATIAKATINAMIRARKHYKGSGNPKLWTTEDVLTEMLLLEDGIGHKLYKTEAELATALRVSEIVTVEPMEGQKIDFGSDKNLPLIGVIVNMADYNVGADKGGEITNFEDFDIDFNQYKYLIETRISGALVKPYSALTFALKKGSSGAASTQKAS